VIDAGGRVVVLGVPIDPLTIPELHERLLQFVRGNGRATVLHANVHAINLAQRFPWFGDRLRQADLVFCDGHGVMLGARLLGQHLPERITYAEWMWRLAAFCETHGLSLYFLGARDGVAAAAAGRLQGRHPRLRIAGTHHGYFDMAAASPDSEQVIDGINGSRPDIVIVGFGMPLQEDWVGRYRTRIGAPVVLTGGAVFDYVSGRLRRPPRWMTTRGLEWLGRLLIEPGRLWTRYVVGNPLFIARVLRARLSGRRGRVAR
jgi:N-acetylglucosaminyldiphosphoundecaprenol N-acetyl-beta-D-mannosaminyltransferase